MNEQEQSKNPGLRITRIATNTNAIGSKVKETQNSVKETSRHFTSEEPPALLTFIITTCTTKGIGFIGITNAILIAKEILVFLIHHFHGIFGKI